MKHTEQAPRNSRLMRYFLEQSAHAAERRAKAAFKTEFPYSGKRFAKLRSLAEKLKQEAGL